MKALHGMMYVETLCKQPSTILREFAVCFVRRVVCASRVNLGVSGVFINGFPPFAFDALGELEWY